MEEEDPLEAKEKLEELSEHSAGWVKYLAITTALIAVIAALASLFSGSWANQAILEKNNAILLQSKASDQWNYYQAASLKRHIAEAFYSQNNDIKLKNDISKYTKEQDDISKAAKDIEKQVEDSNTKSETLFEKHHKASISVTLFQIAIALSAIGALLKRKFFWIFSVILAVIGLTSLVPLFF